MTKTCIGVVIKKHSQEKIFKTIRRSRPESSVHIEVVIAFWEQGNYQPHHSKCTFYINFVLIFKGRELSIHI